MKIKILVILFFIGLAFNSKAGNPTGLKIEDFSIELDSGSVDINNSDVAAYQVKFKRGKAILFTVFTGLFGGHRIYLGTKPRTPILYSVTLGGLGILPVIDLINIIFTKDLSKFEDKPQVIMWGK